MTGGAAPKRRGSAWELRVRDYFRSWGYDAARCYGAGRPDDVGDLVVTSALPIMVECKAVARSERAAVWFDLLRRKSGATASDGPVPLVVERRRGRPVSQAFVTLDLAGFVDVLDALGRLDSLRRREPRVEPFYGLYCAVCGGAIRPRTIRSATGMAYVHVDLADWGASPHEARPVEAVPD